MSALEATEQVEFLAAYAAELATAYPKQGGDYVYLTRSFGRWSGFLFAWAQLWVVRPGSIGALSGCSGLVGPAIIGWRTGI